MRRMSTVLRTLAFVWITVWLQPPDAASAFDDDMSVDQVIIAALESSSNSGRMNNAKFVRVELDMNYTPDVWQAMRENGEISRRKRRKALSNKQLRWLNAVIPFKLETDFSQSDWEVLRQAMEDYEKYTCIRFREAKNDTDRVIIVDNDGCSSQVGRQQGPQYLSLDFQCRNKRTVLHELGHAIGFIHEHSRADRDEYVIINEKSILEKYKGDFQIYSRDQTDDGGIPYDYLSVMHYGQYMASNGNSVITTKDQRYQKRIGRRSSLSFRDVKLANKIYACSEQNKCRRKACPGEGFVGQDCQCWCPSENDAIAAVVCPGCIDFHEYCPNLKLRGLCNKRLFRKYMLDVCPKSCGTCIPGSQ